jgi:hypothetical protein
MNHGSRSRADRSKPDSISPPLTCPLSATSGGEDGQSEHKRDPCPVMTLSFPSLMATNMGSRATGGKTSRTTS